MTEHHDYDPETGELRGEDPAAELVTTTARALGIFRDPEAVRRLTTEVRAGLLARLRMMDTELRRARPEGRLTPPDVAPELRTWADAHDTLAALASVFSAGAQEAKALAGEVVLDVNHDERTTGSVRVGDGRGGDVKVTRQVPTRTSADTEQILSVLVSALVGDRLREDEAGTYGARRSVAWHGGYGRGARDALAKLQELVSPLSWKVTALDAWARKLDDPEPGLAIRLGHAYGRVPYGNPSVKIDRVEAK